MAGTGNGNPADTLPAPKSLQVIANDGTGAHAGAPLRVHPNPTDDLLFVELSGAEIANMALYDLQGRMVAGVHAGTPQPGTTATLDVKSLPAGVYVLRVTDMEGREHLRKVVKK